MSEGRCLGLIGGLGVGAAIHYYRELVSAHTARGCAPDLVMIHADVDRVLRYAAAGNTSGMADYLSSILERLAKAGAQVAAIPSVTPHLCASELLELTPIPLVNLPQEILRELRGQNLARVALFGTRFTMQTGMFGQLAGVEIVQPTNDEMALIQETYMQLVKTGSGTGEQFQVLRRIAHTLCERDQVQAVVLAGTELSLLFNEDNMDFPHLDGAQIHIQAIMRELFRA